MGTDETVLQFLQISIPGDAMKEKCISIRELAEWAFDEDEYIPAVIVHAKTMEELGATRPSFFNEDILFSATPLRVVDFLDDALVLEYNRPLLIKTVSVTIEESLAPPTH